MNIYNAPMRMVHLVSLWLLILLVFSLAPIPSAHAATFMVTKTDDTNDGTCDADCSLREAITAANAAAGLDTITFDSSLNGVPITLTLPGLEDDNATGDLDIKGDLIINGNGSSNTIVNGNGLVTTDRVFHIPGSVTVELNDLTVRNGATTVATQDGAGLSANGGSLVTITNTVFEDNNSADRGGAISIDGGTILTLTNSILNNNTSVDDGGGIANNHPDCVVNVNNSTISANTVLGDMMTNNSDGGGINVDTGTANITNSTITGNSVFDEGGGIATNDGNVTIVGSTISGNSATNDGGGVAISLGGTMTITNSIISGNSAVDDGGGVSNRNGGTMIIEGSIISGNLTIGVVGFPNGAGVHNNGTGSVVTITNSTISGNTTQSAGRGGGVFNTSGATINIHNSTLSDNEAGDDGGGIYNSGTGSTVVLSNSTFSNNSATDRGGAIYSDSGNLTPPLANVDIDNTTFHHNDSGDPNKGSLDTNFGATTIDNSILTGNLTGVDCRNRNGGTITGANNLLDSACGTAGNLGMVTGLEPLADNGGPTQTHALSEGSNAIDAGARGCASLATDQRGVTRVPATCDIGAYEAGDFRCSIQGDSEPMSYTFFTSPVSITIEIVTHGANLDCLLATHIPWDHPNATSGIQTGQYWSIKALQSDKVTAATGYVANLTLPHNIAPDTDTAVCKWLEGAGSGGGWDCARTGSTASTVLRNAVPGFSDWAVGNNVGPTAVSLQSVSVSSQTAVPLAMLFLLLLVGLLSWRLGRR